jgi:hypothetical protein
VPVTEVALISRSGYDEPFTIRRAALRRLVPAVMTRLVPSVMTRPPRRARIAQQHAATSRCAGTPSRWAAQQARRRTQRPSSLTSLMPPPSPAPRHRPCQQQQQQQQQQRQQPRPGSALAWAPPPLQKSYILRLAPT